MGEVRDVYPCAKFYYDSIEHFVPSPACKNTYNVTRLVCWDHLSSCNQASCMINASNTCFCVRMCLLASRKKFTFWPSFPEKRQIWGKFLAGQPRTGLIMDGFISKYPLFEELCLWKLNVKWADRPHKSTNLDSFHSGSRFADQSAHVQQKQQCEQAVSIQIYQNLTAASIQYIRSSQNLKATLETKITMLCFQRNPTKIRCSIFGFHRSILYGAKTCTISEKK